MLFYTKFLCTKQIQIEIHFPQARSVHTVLTLEALIQYLYEMNQNDEKYFCQRLSCDDAIPTFQFAVYCLPEL